jgi:hypothetical protein
MVSVDLLRGQRESAASLAQSKIGPSAGRGQCNSEDRDVTIKGTERHNRCSKARRVTKEEVRRSGVKC